MANDSIFNVQDWINALMEEGMDKAQAVREAKEELERRKNFKMRAKPRDKDSYVETSQSGDMRPNWATFGLYVNRG